MKHDDHRTSRRALLNAAALGLGAQFLPSLAGRARAAGPTRLLIVTNQHQTIPGAWAMRRTNPVGKMWSYPLSEVPDAQLSDVFKPLAAYKDKVTAIEGLSLFTGMGPGFYNNHDASHSNLLTGAGLNTADPIRVLGPSVDQVIAKATKVAGRPGSIEIGAGMYTGGFSALGAGSKTPALSAPSAIFKALFSNVTTTPTTPSGPTPQDQLKTARGDVLDLVSAQAKRIQAKLSMEDRRKLDAHLQYVAEYRSEFVVGSQVSCGALPQVVDGGTNPELVSKWGKLVAAAFACNVTRVATIQIAQLRNAEFGAPAGDVHQDYAHNGGAAGAVAEMRKYTTKMGEIFGDLVKTFAAAGLLDSTVIVWLSEHGLTDVEHQMVEAPALLAGNFEGKFKTGRYISLPRATKSPRGEMVGVPHSKLLVSLMQGMGLPNNSINIENWQGVSVSGPLTELTT